MRKGFYVVFFVCIGMVFFSTGCTDKKPVATDSTEVVQPDSDTTALDTLEEIMAETPIPKAADELFDDFIYNFLGNRKFQKSRIKWPLPVVSGSRTSLVQAKKWTQEQLFLPQSYYTLILDSRKELKLSKDTSVNHVVVEQIQLEEGNVRSFVFDRLDGQWQLTKVSTTPMEQNVNASFLAFYDKFSVDSAFQAESLAESISFSGPDPDDEYKDVHTSIAPDDWLYYAPTDLPQGTIYNIIYGEKIKSGKKKYFLLRGIANGQEMEMTFQLVDDEWKLTGVKE